MNEIEFRFIPLTFISSHEEIEKQIKNTIVLRYILEKYKDIRKLGTLLESTQYGYTASANSDGDCRFLRITDIQGGNVNWEIVPFCVCKEKETYILRQNDFLVARTGGTTGKSYIITEKIDNTVFASYLIRLRTKKELYPNYLNLFLNSYTYWSQITQLKRGSAQPNVNAQKLRELIIPYCPTDEQIRIVSLLNSDSFAYDDKLKNEINDTIEKFHLNLELSNLIDKQLILVNKLRQAILQEAVQGKLVPQDPDDEPASELLEKIKAEKEKLFQGKNKEKALPPIKEDEIPYELPKGWEWVRLGYISKAVEYGTSYKASDLGIGVPILRMNNLVNGNISYSNLKYVPESIEDLPRLFIKHDDILFNRTNSYELVGKAGIHKGESDKYTFASYLIRISMLDDFTDADYINIVLNSIYFRQTQIEPHIIQQCGQANYNGSKLKNSLISIPPFNEQKRIVEKVNELMKLCDELESQLAQSKQESEKLMQAVLQEAFQGAM